MAFSCVMVRIVHLQMLSNYEEALESERGQGFAFVVVLHKAHGPAKLVNCKRVSGMSECTLHETLLTESRAKDTAQLINNLYK